MRRWPDILRDFPSRADACTDRIELALLVEAAGRALGFEYVAVLHTASLVRSSPRLMRYDNYPQGWERRLVGRGQHIVDPITSIARRRFAGFLWSEALVDFQPSGAQKAILDDAFRVGIRQGFTIPANVPGEPEGSVTFATRSTNNVERERRRMAEEIGRQAFDQARRIISVELDACPVLHISPREREIIAWIARGKADVDIELPPSEWSIDYESLDQGRDDECLPRSTSPKRSSGSCVKLKSCWARAGRPPRRAGGSRSASRPTIAGARNMVA